MKQDRILGLDFLRFLAILLVLHAHTARYIASPTHTRFALGFIGFVGVELFFVLSGFLIGTILLTGFSNKDQPFYKTLGTFWLRRWWRTLPNYFLAFWTTALCVQWVTGHNILNFPDYKRYWWFGQNLFSAPPALFTVAWSLSVEEWFYLLLPLLSIPGLMILGRGRSKIVVLSAASLIVLSCLSYRLWLHGHIPLTWDQHYRQMVSTRLDGIAFGVIAAWARMRFPATWENMRLHCLLLGIGVVLTCTITFLISDGYSGVTGRGFGDTFYFSLFSFGLSLLLPFFSNWKAPNQSWIGRFIGHVAAISYSLYLYHTTWIMVLDRKWMPKALGWKPWLISWLGAWAIASIVYYLLEKPSLQFRDRILR